MLTHHHHLTLCRERANLWGIRRDEHDLRHTLLQGTTGQAITLDHILRKLLTTDRLSSRIRRSSGSFRL
ncbi:MAG: hypothetical protein ACI8RZ_005312 [Myxococcota bacterium]|jgi:hypothetical protein